MSIPGFSAEHSLATLALHHHLAGRRRTNLFSCLHLMQEDETGNYDNGDGSEDDSGGGDGDGSGDNNTAQGGAYFTRDYDTLTCVNDCTGGIDSPACNDCERMLDSGQCTDLPQCQQTGEHVWTCTCHTPPLVAYSR